jgi:conflict system STAND superfamily ATPase
MTTSSTSAGVNPFVGPRPLETGQRIFGRDREIEELYYLLSAERIVLLHSPSGAGKSSLIRAGLVPRLAERFDVRGPTRLNTQPPEGTPVNRYVRSANLGFEQGLPEERRRADDLISRMTLAEYVEGRPRRRSAPQNVVLIFDQFEEILTADPLAFDAKREFFRQLGELLQDPRIWVLFALREDYLAPLDPYVDQIPTHLKNRFRVDLLSREASQEAMVGTATEGGRTFAQDAVEKLVMDLATMKVQQPDGSFESQVGPHVEPLHLQVACRGLWERMPPTDLSIDLEDIKSFGDVTRALATYYADVVGAKPGVQRAIREWIGEKLITKDGIRSQALRGVGTSEGLLVRAEQRGGATWYELAHDRVVEPVRTSNAEWFKEKLHPMQRQARLWKQEDEPDRLLLRDRDLKEAESWARDNAASVLPIEKKLLDSSAKKRRAARTKVAMIAFVICMIGAAGIGGVIALQEGQRAAERRAQADAYFQVHQASLQLAPGGDFRSALRLLESAFTTHPDFTTRSAFLSALAKAPNQLETSFTGLKGDVKQLRFGPDGVLAAVAGGSVRLLDTQNAGASGPSCRDRRGRARSSFAGHNGALR